MPVRFLSGQTLGNLRVLIHIPVVVVIDETVVNRLPENRQSDRRQKNADAGDQPAVIQTGRRAFGLRRNGRARTHGGGFFIRFLTHGVEPMIKDTRVV